MNLFKLKNISPAITNIGIFNMSYFFKVLFQASKSYSHGCTFWRKSFQAISTMNWIVYAICEVSLDWIKLNLALSSQPLVSHNFPAFFVNMGTEWSGLKPRLDYYGILLHDKRVFDAI